LFKHKKDLNRVDSKLDVRPGNKRFSGVNGTTFNNWFNRVYNSDTYHLEMNKDIGYYCSATAPESGVNK
jgi:hypothetical protein